MIWAAVFVSVIVAAATVIDQTGAQSLYGFTDAAYASHGATPDPGLVYGILYAVAFTVALIWALMLVVVKARGWWPPVLSAAATLVTGAVAILLSATTEYGERIFAPVCGLVMLVPTIFGIASTVQLVRDARH
ncbi:hypothetical protein GCM10023197_12840 [Gordonia humi]